MAAGGMEIGRVRDRPSADARCHLFYGPDESGSRAQAARLAMTFGAEAERIDLTPAQLRADPTLLADEAASASLFGGARYIRVEGAGEECLAAVDALLGAAVAGNPVILLAGALKKDAKLVKRIDGDRAGTALASWPPSAADIERLAVEEARALGMRLDRDTARRLVGACNGDRAVLARELEKLALYAEADPGTSIELSDAMIDAVGVDGGEADLGRLLDAVFGGDDRALAVELARAGSDGQGGIPLVRAALRRILPMAAARGEIDRGGSSDNAIARNVFGRDRKSVGRDLPHWPALRIATVIERLVALERELKSGRGPGPVAADHSLLAMARTGRRR